MICLCNFVFESGFETEWISTLKSTIMLKAENEIKAMTTIEGNIYSINHKMNAIECILIDIVGDPNPTYL